MATFQSRAKSSAPSAAGAIANHGDSLLAAAVGSAALALYVLTLAPDVLDQDSGEFQYAAYSLSLPHPTGYPLYMLLGRVWSLLPIGGLAFRMNLLSAVFAALTIAALYVFARGVGVGRLAAVSASLIVAVSRTFWSQATIAEVYALGSFLMAAALACAVAAGRSVPPPRWRSCRALAITTGLGLAHHHTIVFIIPGVAIYLWPVLNRGWGERRQLLILGVLLLLPLLLYLYIPWRAPSLGLAGSLDWALGSPFAANLRLDALPALWSRALSFGSLAATQFSPPGAAIALLGLVTLVANRRRLLALTAPVWLAAAAFYLLYPVDDAAVFILPAVLIAGLWLAFGIDRLAALRQRLPAAGNLALPIIFLLLPVSLLLANYRDNDMSARNGLASYWQSVLAQNMERGAVVVADGGRLSPLRYYQSSAGRRGDLDAAGARLSTPAGWQILVGLLEAGRTVYLLDPLTRVPADYQIETVGQLTELKPVPRSQERDWQAPAAPLASDGLRLVGYQAARKSPAGSEIDIDLIWGVEAAPTEAYSTYVHLVDPRDGRPVAQQDKGGEDYTSYGHSTLRWTAGREMRDRFRLPIPRDLPPGAYAIEAGLYVWREGLVTPAGNSRIGRVSILAAEEGIPGDRTFDVTLGGQLRLLDARIVPGSLIAGSDLQIATRWEATQAMSADYTIFVHLIAADGRLVTQLDSQPLEGRYPTSLWEAGEVVLDQRRLTVPAGVTPGDYRVYAGVYQLETMERLERPEGGDVVDLGTVRIER